MTSAIEPKPLGDQAALVTLPDEESAWRFAEAARRCNLPGRQDVVQAYSSVAVFFDRNRTRFDSVAKVLREINLGEAVQFEPRKHRIPVCYDLGPDLARVAEATHLTKDQVIDLHSSIEYTVYAIGFCPGFPYLGYLPAKLCGLPRLPSPRVRVEPGSVGLTGRQTGIYPLPRPGGWNLIGRTPLVIVDPEDNFFPLQVGDHVQFYRIDASEYRRMEGSRLATPQPSLQMSHGRG